MPSAKLDAVWSKAPDHMLGILKEEVIFFFFFSFGSAKMSSGQQAEKQAAVKEGVAGVTAVDL